MAGKEEKAENMRLLHDTIIYCLTEAERKYFIDILCEFQDGRDRRKFVLSLRRLLSTAGKQEVVPYLLAILPVRDREHFLQLWMKTSNYNAFYVHDVRSNRTQINSRNSSRNTTYTYPYPLLEKNDKNANRNLYTQSLPLQSRAKQKSVTFKTSSTLSESPRSILNSLSNHSRQKNTPKTHFVLLKRDAKNDDFGFSIRGGLEHGLGIFISSVEEGSVADKKNLIVGDQIVKLNEYNFENIEHSKAVEIIQQCKKLKMLIFSSGVIPGSRQAHVEYQWVDVRGRPCSPPPGADRKDRRPNGHRNYGDVTLLQDETERRVILHVHRGTRLGLKIRGGWEYGLGIYVSSVDRNHVAEKSGIRVGDQILDVNGIDFIEIEHRDAVRVLKSCKIMNMILRDVRKIPYSRTVLEKTEWLDDKAISRSSSVMSLSSSFGNSFTEKSMFRQGIAGSQLLHQSAIVAPFQRLVDVNARSVLSNNEQETLKYYLSEYGEEQIHVEGLVITLFHLLDTPEKLSLLNDIRCLIFPQDVDLFDRLVLEKERNAVKELPTDSSPPRSWAPLNRNVLIHQEASQEINSPTQEIEQQNKIGNLQEKSNFDTASHLSSNNNRIKPAKINEEILSKHDAFIAEDTPVIEDLSFEDDEEDIQIENESSLNYEQSPGPIEDSGFLDIKETSVYQSWNGRDSISESAEARNITEGVKHDQNGLLRGYRNSIVDDEGDYNKPKERPAEHEDEYNKSKHWSIDQKGKPIEVNDESTALMRDTSTELKDESVEPKDKSTEPDSVGFALMRNALLGFSDANYHDDHTDDNDDNVADFSDAALDIRLREEKISENETIMNTVSNTEEIEVEDGRRDDGDYDDDDKIVARIQSMQIDVTQTSNVVNESTEERGDSVNDDPKIIYDSQHSISVKDDLSKGSMTYKENMSNLQGLHGVPDISLDSYDDYDDLEFEFEEEPDIEGENEIFTPLKFAPIRIQETPTKFALDETDNTKEAEIQSGLVTSHECENNYGDYEPVDITLNRNRRQQYKVADVTENESVASELFNITAEQSDFEAENKMVDSTNIYVESPSLELRLSKEDNYIYSKRFSEDDSSPSSENSNIELNVINSVSRNSNSDTILQIPDRNLTNKRFNIIDYETNNNTKTIQDFSQRETGLTRTLNRVNKDTRDCIHEHEHDRLHTAEDPIQREFGLTRPWKRVNADTSNRVHEPDHLHTTEDFIQRETGLTRPLKRANTDTSDRVHEHEHDHLKSTFNKLRSIFEFQRPEEPKTEYLSEIIKKNNDIGRRKIEQSGVKMERTSFKNQHKITADKTNGNHDKGFDPQKKSFEYQTSIAESDLSSTDDFDFSSISPRISDRLHYTPNDDKIENSSGYGSEEYFNYNDTKILNVQIEKDRPDIGIRLEPTKNGERGVQIKEIMNGENFAACHVKQLKRGQELISIDGEQLQGLGPLIAEITLKRSYNNPSGRFLQLVLKATKH